MYFLESMLLFKSLLLSDYINSAAALWLTIFNQRSLLRLLVKFGLKTHRQVRLELKSRVAKANFDANKKRG